MLYHANRAGFYRAQMPPRLVKVKVEEGSYRVSWVLPAIPRVLMSNARSFVAASRIESMPINNEM